MPVSFVTGQTDVMPPPKTERQWKSFELKTQNSGEIHLGLKFIYNL